MTFHFSKVRFTRRSDRLKATEVLVSVSCQMKYVAAVDQRGATVDGWRLLQEQVRSHQYCTVCLETLNDATLGNLSCQGQTQGLML